MTKTVTLLSFVVCLLIRHADASAQSVRAGAILLRPTEYLALSNAGTDSARWVGGSVSPGIVASALGPRWGPFSLVASASLAFGQARSRHQNGSTSCGVACSKATYAFTSEGKLWSTDVSAEASILLISSRMLSPSLHLGVGRSQIVTFDSEYRSSVKDALATVKPDYGLRAGISLDIARRVVFDSGARLHKGSGKGEALAGFPSEGATYDLYASFQYRFGGKE